LADQINGLFSPFLRRKRVEATKPYYNGRVLDYGCGIGTLAELIPADRYFGVDVDTESIQIAKTKHSDHSFGLCDELPTEEMFDSIVSLAVIEHVSDPNGFIENLKDHLNPGGKIVMTTPNPIFEPIHDLGSHIGLFSHDALDEHESLMNRGQIAQLAKDTSMDLELYSRFLWGANQLIVLSKSS
jgi:2-polyprenyl-3-methyl-5-hydroxy-6-metoxy-1,4-benzoquinol methylase